MTQTVLITGAASGMGLSMTKRFLSAGQNVVMADFDASKGQSLAAKFQTEFPNQQVDFYQVDVSSPTAVDQLAKQVLAKYAHIDTLINCAGIFAKGALHELTLETWNKVLAVDVTAIFLMTKAFINTMIAQKSGVIINIASISGLYGDYNMAAYSAAKGAVANLVRSMALDYGKYNIRVNNIVPGPTNTPLFQQNPPEVIAKFNQASPLNKIVEPADVANMAYFLASEQAQAITGQNLQVTAGFGIHSGQPQQ